MLAGFVEPAHFNDFHFESERRTFDTFGYARDPTAEPVNTSGQPAVAGSTSAPRYVGEKIKAEKLKGMFVFDRFQQSKFLLFQVQQYSKAYTRQASKSVK
jgi:pre-mRNA-processing factor 17